MVLSSQASTRLVHAESSDDEEEQRAPQTNKGGGLNIRGSMRLDASTVRQDFKDAGVTKLENSILQWQHVITAYSEESLVNRHAEMRRTVDQYFTELFDLLNKQREAILAELKAVIAEQKTKSLAEKEKMENFVAETEKSLQSLFHFSSTNSTIAFAILKALLEEKCEVQPLPHIEVHLPADFQEKAARLRDGVISQSYAGVPSFPVPFNCKCVSSSDAELPPPIICADGETAGGGGGSGKGINRTHTPALISSPVSLTDSGNKISVATSTDDAPTSNNRRLTSSSSSGSNSGRSKVVISIPAASNSGSGGSNNTNTRGNSINGAGLSSSNNNNSNNGSPRFENTDNRPLSSSSGSYSYQRDKKSPRTSSGGISFANESNAFTTSTTSTTSDPRVLRISAITNNSGDSRSPREYNNSPRNNSPRNNSSSNNNSPRNTYNNDSGGGNNSADSVANKISVFNSKSSTGSSGSNNSNTGNNNSNTGNNNTNTGNNGKNNDGGRLSKHKKTPSYSDLNDPTNANIFARLKPNSNRIKLPTTTRKQHSRQPSNSDGDSNNLPESLNSIYARLRSPSVDLDSNNDDDNNNKLLAHSDNTSTPRYNVPKRKHSRTESAATANTISYIQSARLIEQMRAHDNNGDYDDDDDYGSGRSLNDDGSLPSVRFQRSLSDASDISSTMTASTAVSPGSTRTGRERSDSKSKKGGKEGSRDLKSSSRSGTLRDSSINSMYTITPASDVVISCTKKGFLNMSTSFKFRQPRGILYLAKIGYLYVCDNHAIRKIDSHGHVSTFTGGDTEGYKDGSKTEAQFNCPDGICYYEKENVFFVVDYGNQTIRKVNAKGSVEPFVGSGKAESKDGFGTFACFNRPCGIAIDQRNGDLYVTDSFGHTVRKVTQIGRVETIAGGSDVSGYADGDGKSARFRFPTGLAFDEVTESLFIADTYNHCIRKYDLLTGRVSTIAGCKKWGSQDGEALSATFTYPIGIALLPSDESLLVADRDSSRIRKIHLTGEPGIVESFSETSHSSSIFPHSLCVYKGTCYITDYDNGNGTGQSSIHRHRLHPSRLSCLLMPSCPLLRNHL